MDKSACGYISDNGYIYTSVFVSLYLYQITLEIKTLLYLAHNTRIPRSNSADAPAGSTWNR